METVTIELPYETVRNAIRLCSRRALELRREGSKNPDRLRSLLEQAEEYEQTAAALDRALERALSVRS